MHKKIIALAVSGFAAGSACAQNNVSIYGVMDASMTNITTTNQKSGSVKNQRGPYDGSNPSRIGFKGEEKLSDGLKAEFTYEIGLSSVNNVAATNPTTGTTSPTLNNLSTRQSFVALASDSLGKIAAGRFQTPAYDYGGRTRMLGGLADTHRTMAAILGASIHCSDRLSNSLFYTSPTWNGFTAKALYSADGSSNADINTNDQDYNGTTAGRQPVYLLSGDYSVGAFTAYGVYRKLDKQHNASTDTGKSELAVLGAYDFGAIRLSVNYHTVHKNVVSNNFQNGRIYGGEIMVRLSDNFRTSLVANRAVAERGIGGNGFAINAIYDLSKRTNLYAQAGHYSLNTANVGNVASTNIGAYPSTGLEAGQTANFMLAGLNHKF